MGTFHTPVNVKQHVQMDACVPHEMGSGYSWPFCQYKTIYAFYDFLFMQNLLWSKNIDQEHPWEVSASSGQNSQNTINPLCVKRGISETLVQHTGTLSLELYSLAISAVSTYCSHDLFIYNECRRFSALPGELQAITLISLPHITLDYTGCLQWCLQNTGFIF